MPQTTRPAFTLIELLVVIAITATLLAMLIPAISVVRDSSRRAAAKTMVRQLVTGLEQYRDEDAKKRFPPPEIRSFGGLSLSCLSQVLAGGGDGPLAMLDSRRMVTLQGDNLRDGVLTDPWGHPYAYFLKRDAAWWPTGPLEAADANGRQVLDNSRIEGVHDWFWRFDPERAPATWNPTWRLYGTPRNLTGAVPPVEGHAPFLFSFGKQGLPPSLPVDDASHWVF